MYGIAGSIICNYFTHALYSKFRLHSVFADLVYICFVLDKQSCFSFNPSMLATVKLSNNYRKTKLI